MNRTGNIAAHPSPVTSLISYLFLAILFFPSPSVPLFPVLWSLTSSWVVVLSMRGLVSFMEPQQIEDIPLNVVRSLVCLEFTRFVVFLQNRSRVPTFFCPNKLKLNAERLGNWQLLSGTYKGLTSGSKTSCMQTYLDIQYKGCSKYIFCKLRIWISFLKQNYYKRGV